MKSLRSFRLLGMLTLLLSLMAIPISALAQRDTPQQPQSPSTQSPSQDAQQTQTFTGKLVKSKGAVVLRDESSNTTYRLDNGEQAKQYLGKSVKVTGTLDPATNTLHVSNIEIMSGPSS